ncbi:MAG: SDR family oxidoreductase [Candidimonas sp.]|nr:MAG: SDR family oxidoreductase [Candidimonas sp.]TAM25083.1 MAG: SDR family oxidoreductase [Candidimonas sp.]TAM74920.1 MAG: SDR family oxidoreductase [Candidimonas sp.]
MSRVSDVVVVTGGASGIGLALVRGLLAEGWKVLVLDLLPERVAAVEKEFQSPDPSRICGVAVNVTDEVAVAAAIDRCEAEFGPVAGLVNSAGIAAVVPFLQTEVAAFRKILEVNVIGSFIVAKAVSHKMMQRAVGSIINISSVSGQRGSYGRTAYGASKGAIITMTRVMANELAEFGIRVNAIAPGPIDTPMVKAMHTQEARGEWNAAVPMHRYGAPEELCGTANWLLDSTKSSYVTGQIIAVDGGFESSGLISHHAA